MVQYFVIGRAAKWWVGLDGCDYGPYASREEAVAAAICSAEICVAEGAAAKVQAENRLGGFVTLWTGAGSRRAA